MKDDTQNQIHEILDQVRKLASRYYILTNKPLGVTGEIGEHFAAKYLDLRLAPPREPGFDAINNKGQKIQVKARCIPSGEKFGAQRLGRIRLEQDWDKVVFVHMYECFEPVIMYQAERLEVEKALTTPGSKARNERGSLSYSKFKSISKIVWIKDAINNSN